MNKDINKLVKNYADCDPSDTFVSYNDAIMLAREVRRLRDVVAKLKRLGSPKRKVKR